MCLPPSVNILFGEATTSWPPGGIAAAHDLLIASIFSVFNVNVDAAQSGGLIVASEYFAFVVLSK
jgi:hypothetical protein